MQFESLGLTGLFLSAFISSTIAPGGSEVILAYMINRSANSIYELVIIASIGNTLGAITTWGIGIWAAKKYPAETLLSSRQQKALYTVRHWGGWVLLFSWLPIVGDGLCFAGGWLKLPPISSFIAIFSGKVLRYLAVAYAFV
ncbi:DedA family protein [Methylomonas sp. AM2-LC]|uniref:YqaA family protein n=1 Tax=Methylomonas sp. AM2-LC TaxID=3153301 RepID=UPI00326308CE